MSRRIRPYPVLPWDDRRVNPHLRDIRLKVLSDIDAFIRRGEYGKASALLHTITCSGSLPIRHIWQPLIAVVRQQAPHALGAFLDMIIPETRTQAPFSAALERIFTLLPTAPDRAHAMLLAFTTDTGANLSMAHGMLGVVTACLRELELHRIRTRRSIAEPQVFGTSEFAQFVLSRSEPGQGSKYGLGRALRHLERAAALDSECDFFVPFHAQVLVALDRQDAARDMLVRRYQRDNSVHVLRMVMALDPRPPEEQTDYMFEFLERDPYASESAYFGPFVGRQLAQLADLPDELTTRVLLVVVDRIERGAPEETDKWRALATLVRRLGPAHPAVRSTMELRVPWWRTMYFAQSVFDCAEATDRLVYMAVCAQQLDCLEPGHPAYRMLSGKLSDRQADFVDTHIILPAEET
ncbi:hypothetical protein IWW55_001479 [Coemansia sp. RSA 2706]|nr:hypothetical protein IWW55_001479 [Coemansia sp. RSA 2706]KAJ2732357.1 hypothetical protein H4R23_002861 [Coemansia sp. Cherry 401B]